ncbi:uncharacterized protein [Nerophis lumbriciformis]|uniref:uncharacterized protein isoform X2 n=1 Tax=Nerophis lumbriciformis TaxID=546530 RepID=UPI002ADF2E84|nr:uncharacterized protein si:dkey-66i24.7 isoform X2 [Nerophis lumbriciformis]
MEDVETIVLHGSSVQEEETAVSGADADKTKAEFVWTLLATWHLVNIRLEMDQAFEQPVCKKKKLWEAVAEKEERRQGQKAGGGQRPLGVLQEDARGPGQEPGGHGRPAPGQAERDRGGKSRGEQEVHAHSAFASRRLALPTAAAAASAGRPAAVHGAAGEEAEHVGPAEGPGGEEDRGPQQLSPGHLQPGSERLSGGQRWPLVPHRDAVGDKRQQAF